MNKAEELNNIKSMIWDIGIYIKQCGWCFSTKMKVKELVELVENDDNH